MTTHANYAAAISIRQDLIQNLVRVMYHAGRIIHRLTGEGSGIAVNLFVDVPQIICSAQNLNRLALKIRAWGPITVAATSSVRETKTALLNATILVSPELSLQNASISFKVNGLSAILETFQIIPLSGGPFSPQNMEFLGSPEVHSMIQLALRLQLSSMEEITPAFSVSFMGDIANATNATLTSRVLNDALVIGLDINEGGIQTHGDPNLLINAANTNHIAVWQNPNEDVLEVAMATIYTKVNEAVIRQGATLDSFSITVEEGHFHMAGAASKTGGSVSFSMNAMPHLVRPDIHTVWEENGERFETVTPGREELWFEMRDVHIDVDRDWWVYVVETLTGLITVGIGAMIIESFINMVRNDVRAGIESVSNTPISNRTQYFTFEDTLGPTMQLRLEQFECHAEGLYTGITIEPQYPRPSMQGPAYRAIEDIQEQPILYSVQFPFLGLPDDPQIRVRWTVRRKDTNEVILTEDNTFINKRSLDLRLLEPVFLQTEDFRIECRIYRVLGAVTEEIFNSSLSLSIVDTLDRSHPFVRWRHWVFAPIVKVEPNGSHTLSGMRLSWRNSRIHRTDVPGRCQMVSKYSLHYPGPPFTEFGHWAPAIPTPAPEMEYLDTLPFDREDLIKNREKLCDYCFFGGPTKTMPLIS